MPPVRRVLLCRPEHFNVDYIINPHMSPHSVDTGKAMEQWKGLVAALRALGIKVEVIDQQPDVPDMVFATDQGIVRDGAVLLANFRYRQRQRERVYYREWFRDHGFRLRALSNIFPFEGGDTLFFDDMLFVGTGFRAGVASCEELARKLEVDVIPRVDAGLEIEPLRDREAAVIVAASLELLLEVFETGRGDVGGRRWI